MTSGLWRNFDWVALLVVLLLVILGGVMIYSAEEASAPPSDRGLWDNSVFRQMVFAVAGLSIYFVVAAVDYRTLLRVSWWIYVGVTLLLVATAVIGQALFGAQSWVQFQYFDVQPSELCKVLMVLVMARELGDSKRGLESPIPFILSALLIVPPVLLIYLQPDFGTALILVATWVSMSFLSGVRWRHLFLFGFIGSLLIPVAWFRLEDYMRHRILLFFFPGEDLSGASYNINQALISIGSGGWWGKGLLKGTQSQLHFLRVRHTDFVFSVLAEELGFVGSVLVLTLFLVLALRLVHTALNARDLTGRLIAGGVASMILIQALVNVGMNVNILPVTGLPLPLVSYGGSSLVTTLLGLGFAQSVAMRHTGADQSFLMRAGR